MRRLLTSVAAVLLLLAIPVPLPAEPQGIVAHTVFTYTKDYGCLLTGCSGDLVTCPMGEAMVTAKMTYLFMEGVCDDGGANPCKGRLRGLLEDCLKPARDLNVRGGMMSITVQGRFRLCFDDTAASDCTGDPPAGIVVGEGVNRFQARSLIGARAPMQASDELILTAAPAFVIDGKETTIDSTVTVYDASLQPDLTGNNCGGAGCGGAGTAVVAPSR